MSGVWILDDFHSGKRTVKGKPNPALRHFETVTVILPDRIDSVLGAKTLSERKTLLRELRDTGKLVVSQNPRVQRLTHKVRGEDGERFRAYVFAVDHPDTVAYLADRIRHPERYKR
jgi:hypothetical protein